MSRVRGLAAVAGLASVLGGCWWPVAGQGPDRQAHNASENQISPATVAGLQEAWTAEVDAGPVGDPVTSVGRVHVNDSSNVYGFGSTTGARDWVFEPPAGTVMEQPLVHGDQVQVGTFTAGRTTGTGPTIALDTATGALVGTVSPDEVLVTARNNRALYWTRGVFYPQLPEYWSARVRVRDVDSGAWLCCDDLIFAAASDSTRPIRLTLGGGDLFYDAGFGLTHADIDNIGNGVRAYTISTPRTCSFIAEAQCPRWAIPLDGDETTVPVLVQDSAGTDRHLYVGTDAGTLYGVTAGTGAVEWSTRLGAAITDAPAYADGFLYVPTASGDLAVVDAGACGAGVCPVRWRAATGSPVTQQPAVAGGVVFTTSADGTIHAYDAAGCGAATCPALWSASTGSEITGAPAISGGQVYVGTADGRVVAYALPDG